MKTKKSKEETAAPSPKGKVKLKNLKLTKETIETLTDRDAEAIKGGSMSVSEAKSRYCPTQNHNESFVYDQES